MHNLSATWKQKPNEESVQKQLKGVCEYLNKHNIDYSSVYIAVSNEMLKYFKASFKDNSNPIFYNGIIFDIVSDSSLSGYTFEIRSKQK